MGEEMEGEKLKKKASLEVQNQNKTNRFQLKAKMKLFRFISFVIFFGV